MKTLLVLSSLLAMAGSGLAADYGKKEHFTKGKALAFPDCEFTFTGTRRVSSPAYPRGFLYYDFEARSGGKTKAVSWSSGTGDIGPESFEVNGRKFVLELSSSAAFKGWMKDDELVLWRESDFRKLKK
jgi:hypothetical protein